MRDAQSTDTLDAHAPTAPARGDEGRAGDAAATATRSADLPALTGLRFLAAAVVLLYHADTFTALLPEAIHRAARAGYAAVGLFYVLSGFLLSRRWGAALAAGAADAGTFVRARLARIAPLHLVGVAWSYVLFRLADWPAGTLALPVGAALLGVHAWFPGFVFRTNAPSWSVSDEVFFYVAFPLLARRLVGAAARARAVSILGVAWVLGLAPSLWLLVRPEINSNFVCLSPITRLPEFVMGMALGRLFALDEAEGRAHRPSGGLVPGSLVGLAIAAWFERALPYPLFHNALLSPLFCALIFGLARGEPLSRVLGRRGLVHLGELSFAVYIFQEPLKETLARIVLYVGTPAEVVTGHLVFFAASVGLAALAWRLVEQPARRAIVAAQASTLRLAGGVVVLVALAFAAFGLDHARHPFVVLTGNFQRFSGCARDWDPTCERTRMRRVEAEGAGADAPSYAHTLSLPAGHWELKVVRDGSWHESVGAPGGGNVALDLLAPTDVEVRYSPERETITTSAPRALVTLAGSFQRAVGCAEDWAPDCPETRMADPDGDGVYGWETRALAAGHHAAKVALGGSWRESFGRDGAPDDPNFEFDVPADGAVMRFAWDARTHRLDATSP